MNKPYKRKLKKAIFFESVKNRIRYKIIKFNELIQNQIRNLNELVKNKVGTCSLLMKSKIKYFVSLILQLLPKKTRRKIEKLSEKVTKKYILNKLLISISYFIPFLSISISTHYAICHRFPSAVPTLVPYFASLIRNFRVADVVLESPLFLMYYYLMGNMMLAPEFRFLGINRQAKFSFIMANTLEFIYSMVIEYFEFLSFTATISGMYPPVNHKRAIIYTFIFGLWTILYPIFYICSMNNVYPLLPEGPLFYYPRKVLYSILFWVRIVPKKRGKKK
jgi:hypothetical protein